MEHFSALELSASIRTGQLSVADTVRHYLDVIDKNDQKYKAFITVCADRALAQAEVVQKQIMTGKNLSPLAGVPIALKDNISTAGVKTTCASKMLENYVPVYNATVVDKLERAGMIVIGKLNMDEFAMGSSSETGIFGQVRNPRDTSRVAGGSSGGSAAAVAGGEVPLALGSDTGGSIRQPCSFCGVTGIKPTYGAVSRYGLIAYASSLDQIGAIGTNIDDCAALLSIVSGQDDMDSTCVIDKPFSFEEHTGGRMDGIKIGLASNYLSSGIDEDVKQAVLVAAKQYEEIGAEIVEFDMPLTEYMIPAYYVIACAEASSNLARYDGLKYGRRANGADSIEQMYRLSRNEGFGLEAKRRILLGSFVLTSGYYDAWYKKALQTRTLIIREYNALFKRFDMLLSPTAPTTAYKLGENIDDPMKMYMGDIYTVSVNLAGLPAVALPCGLDRHGLPIGFQLIGSPFSENKLINAARAYQR